MNDSASGSSMPQYSPTLAARLVLFPFYLFGILCGSLLLSVLVEWVGIMFFWPDLGWHHAQQMFQFELAQFAKTFARSLLLSSPAEMSHWLTKHLHDWLTIKSGLREGLQVAIRDPHDVHTFREGLHWFLQRMEDYAVSAVWMVQVFALRCLVILLTLPLFVMAAFAGLVDGLVRRDLRHFTAGHESGFVYHRARASVLPLTTLSWVIYLSLPMSVHPLMVLLPGAAALGIAVDVMVGSFKKHL